MKSILGIPCISCEDMNKCGSHPTIKPETCAKLTAWIESGGKGEIYMRPETPTKPEPRRTPNGWLICAICEKPITSERGLKIHNTRVHGKKVENDEKNKVD